MASMKLIIVFVLFICVYKCLALSSSSCPTSSRIDSCNPQCKDTSNCRGSQICCTNICGTKSCTEINVQKTDKYKGSSGSSSSSKGATGVYCGQTKCGPGEKCEFDRTTKREKCVRG